MENLTSSGVGSVARVLLTPTLAYATEPTRLGVKRVVKIGVERGAGRVEESVEDWRRVSLSAAAGAAVSDTRGESTDKPSEPESVRLVLGENHGSSFWGGIPKGKMNEQLGLEIPPVTYKPKRRRKRPRRSCEQDGESAK